MIVHVHYPGNPKSSDWKSRIGYSQTISLDCKDARGEVIAGVVRYITDEYEVVFHRVGKITFRGEREWSVPLRLKTET